MAIKTDSSCWTGLAPSDADLDVRHAQRPRATGPVSMAAKTFGFRWINWSDALVLLPISLIVGLALSASMAEILKMLILISSILVLTAVAKRLIHFLTGNHPAIVMDEKGLHLPNQFREAIPWSNIGEVGFTYSERVGWISVQADRLHRLTPVYPWPLSKFAGEKRNGPPVHILSCWTIRARPEALLHTIEEFRDNYCAA